MAINDLIRLLELRARPPQGGPQAQPEGGVPDTGGVPAFDLASQLGSVQPRMAASPPLSPVPVPPPQQAAAPNVPQVPVADPRANVIDRMFGVGISERHLGQAGVENAQREALIRAGITLATHRGPGAAKAALEAGRQGYADAAQSALQEQALAWRQQLTEELLQSGNDPNSLLSAARKAAAVGDTETAKALLEMAKAHHEINRPTDGVEGKFIEDEQSGEWKLVNPFDGSVIAEGRFERPAPGQEQLSLSERLNATTALMGAFRNATDEFEKDAQFVDQYQQLAVRAMSPDATSAEQMAFLMAAARIINPRVARTQAGAVETLRETRGFLTGTLKSNFERVLQGKEAHPDVIREWVNTIQPIVQGRIATFDGIKNFYDNQARGWGLPFPVTIDYYRGQRDANPIVGAEHDKVGRALQSLRERGGR